MEKADREEIFAPLQSFVISGKQTYILLKDGHITFCDEQKTNVRSKMLDKLYGINGIVYANGNFRFLEYYNTCEGIKDVYFANRKGKIISHYEKLQGYYRISSDCLIINSDIVSLFNYEANPHYSLPDQGYKSYYGRIICPNGLIGEYIGSLWKDWHIVEKSLVGGHQYLILDRLGNIVFDAEWIWFCYTTDKFRIFGLNNSDGTTIKAWNTDLTTDEISCQKTKYISFDGYVSSYRVEILETDGMLFYLFSDKHNKNDLCIISAHDRITGVINDVFMGKIKILDFGVRSGNGRCEDGYSYWSFNGEYLGGSGKYDRYAILRHHSKELAHLEGVYDVEEEKLVVPYEDTLIEIIKTEIEDDYDTSKQTNYFVCDAGDGKRKIMYKGNVACEDISSYTLVKYFDTDDHGETVIYNSKDEIVICKDDKFLLYIEDKYIMSVECDNLYMLHWEEGNCWFKMYDPITKRQGLLNQKGLYVPLGDNKVIMLKDPSKTFLKFNSLIGIKGIQLYDTDTNAPFIENKQLCFVTMAYSNVYHHEGAIIAYEDIINSDFVFYNEEKEIITGVHEEVEGKGDCIILDEEQCFFCCEDKKLYKKPREQDEDEDDSDENDDNEYYDDGYYNRTYDKYWGTYAQDVAGYSDEDIDEAFDGDPEAYWNID